ncbi:MAG: glycoside hydrolase family 3 domain protein [Amycolatopsis sp.]|uniref:glycoside hydrolase family 3 C-terminal domain-containing protein n=1 Tax=Amycolatopsis sp. TaxID=37632 RepID=UPI002602C4EA|nr:glycoside hydrolase family 3 C-terminal domain-containing protein [Amycolatopsis sp.]MCU1680307.1 glycoside hydrolase family 3 domain protein [Amycolatopsis sp.]
MLARRWLSLIGVIGLAAGAAVVGQTADATPAAVNAVCPWVGSTAPVPQRVSQLLAQMSQAQKISLLHGTGGAYVGNTPAIPALCVPAVGLEDGPAGVGEGLNGVTQLPAPVAAAATWDVAAEQQYGAVVGSEEAGKGSTIDLGPTINIVRDPRWGRAFESMSEDPYLAGQLGAANIKGVQSTGELAQVKHLGVYNQETNRNTPSDNAIIDARTEQEIYLPQFQTSVQQGAASSVMCSYSTVNGTYACQNPGMLNNALDNQFGFPGFVTSDWGATHSTVASANSGMDQEMPGGDFFGSALQTAVTNGQVTQATLNGMVGRILTEMFTFGLFDNAPHGSTGATVTSAAHVTAARQIAEQGTVLLRNNNGALPLNTTSAKSIAVIGTDANTSPLTAGGGSAAVNSSGTVTPLQGITSRAGAGVNVQYAAGDNTGTAATLAKNSSVAVVFVSMNESEGGDLGNIDLPGNQNALISAVAAANPNTIVVLNTGSAVTMPWVNSVAGVLEGWYPGQEDGNAISAVLFGDVNPSGKLPVSFPKSLADVPASTQAQWPGTNGNVQYSEGLNVGYRWYQAKNITPLFPFGFGLSYTTFGFSNLQVSAPDAHGKSTATATVTNTGTRAGSEVAQLYIGDPATTGEPPSQLKGFTKVTLQPGASTTVSFPITSHDLAYWNTASNGWTTAVGTYRIQVGDTSASPQLTGSLVVSSTSTGNAVTVTNPQGMSSPVGTAASLPIQATDSASGQTLTYSATGLPAGLAVNSGTGAISGTATAAGTSTVTVTATDGTGATGTTTFVWTATSGGGGTGGAAGPIVAGVSASLCVDVRGASSANNTAVQLYQCNGTGAQVWTVAAQGALQSLGKCMDVTSAGTANGTKVQLYDCNGSGAQVWQAQSNGSLLNSVSGRCLDDPSASTANSTQLQIWDCNAAVQQRWTLPS